MLPKEFQPTHPEDKKTYLANIPLTRDSRGAERILCVKTGDEIEDNTIVEMSYDSSRKHELENEFQEMLDWDKTDQLRSGASQYGNDYSVAHDGFRKGYLNPITTGMISGRDTVANREEEEHRYYARMITRDRSLTRPMLDFHNLFVKFHLITGFSLPLKMLDY